MVTTSAGRRYKVLGTIGKGGFGTVYKAELIGESGFSKTVALKVLNPDVSDVQEIAERLRDEARILALVHHRSIVQVDSLLQLEGRWTIVMEYVDGVDLKHLIRQGAVPPGPALEIATEVASALRAAREQPGPDGNPLCLLHRDIKPSNIQLTSAGEVKVLDFGTARANFARREAKTMNMAFGTLEYMAPERMEFEDVPAGDVYSLGSVLFELLVGAQLGHTSTRPGWHEHLQQGAVARLQQGGIHEGVIELIRDMLSFAPADRPDLRAVERRGRDLRVACGGPWLSDFAADVVPKILAARTTTDPDEVTGSILQEGSTAHLTFPGASDTGWVRGQATQEPPPTPTPAPTFEPPRPVMTVSPQDVLVGRPSEAAPSSRTGLWVVLGGFGMLLVVGVVALVALMVVLPQRSSDLAVKPEVPTAVVEPVQPEPPDAQTAPRPAAPSATIARGRVVVEGDATSVTLVKGGSRRAPGRVPTGTYTIEATFEGPGTVNAGEVTVTEDGTVTLDCRKASARCSVAVPEAP